MELQSNPGYATFHGNVAGFAYNEAAFRHFLAIERRRAERSRRSFLLVLVSVHSQVGRPSVLSPAVSTELFARLGAAVREVDFFGWYREPRVAAAVLTQQAPASQEVLDLVAARVRTALDMPTLGIRGQLRVRVVSLRGAGSRVAVTHAGAMQQA